MDRLYQQAVDGAKQRAQDAGGAGVAKRGAEEGAGDRGAKKPKKVLACTPGRRTARASPRRRGMCLTCVPGNRPRDRRVQGPGDLKNVPAHRGAFKKHLRKHTLLFQREGGETARAILVTCDQGKEARCIQSGCELIKMALASLSPAAPAADGSAAGGGPAERGQARVLHKVQQQTGMEVRRRARTCGSLIPDAMVLRVSRWRRRA